MHSPSRLPLFVVLLLLLAPLHSGAQTIQTGLARIEPGPRRIDVSGSLGLLLPSDWGDLVVVGSISGLGGVRQQILAREITLDPTASVFDGTVTYWEGRYGFRVHAGFARSCLAIGGRCGASPGSRARSPSVDLDIWSYEIGGAIGMIDYRRDAWAWPYGFFGLGGITYHLEQPIETPLTFIERPPFPSSGVVVSRIDEPAPLLIVVDELNVETKFALTLGVGADFRIPTPRASVGLRVEASDRIHTSPVDVRVAEIDGFFGQDVRVDFGLVHNLGASAGIVIEFGR